MQIIEKINTELSQGDIKIPSIQLNSYYLESISLKKFDFIKDYDTCTKIDKMVTEIQQANFMIQLLRDNEFVKKLNSRSLDVTKDLRSNFKSKIDNIKNLINEIKKHI